MGHVGVQRTLTRLRQFYFWPSMAADVQQAVGHCAVCLSLRQKRKQSTMGPPKGADARRFEWIGADVLTLGDRKYLSITDKSTMFMWLQRLESQQADEICRAYAVTTAQFGACPAYLTVDLEFAKSTAMRNYAAARGTTILPSPSQEPNPRFFERLHRTLRDRFTAMKREHGEEMPEDVLVANALHAVNAMPGENGGPSPFCQMFGVEPPAMTDMYVRHELMQETVPHNERTLADFVLEAQVEASRAAHEARSKKRASNEKNRAERMASPTRWRVGQRVRWHRPGHAGAKLEKTKVYNTGFVVDSVNPSGTTLSLKDSSGTVHHEVSARFVAPDYPPVGRQAARSAMEEIRETGFWFPQVAPGTGVAGALAEGKKCRSTWTDGSRRLRRKPNGKPKKWLRRRRSGWINSG
jgi:hypothetical protein